MTNTYISRSYPESNYYNLHTCYTTLNLARRIKEVKNIIGNLYKNARTMGFSIPMLKYALAEVLNPSKLGFSKCYFKDIDEVAALIEFFRGEDAIQNDLLLKLRKSLDLENIGNYNEEEQTTFSVEILSYLDIISSGVIRSEEYENYNDEFAREIPSTSTDATSVLNVLFQEENSNNISALNESHSNSL